jgi:hypothetical protein
MALAHLKKWFHLVSQSQSYFWRNQNPAKGALTTAAGGTKNIKKQLLYKKEEKTKNDRGSINSGSSRLDIFPDLARPHQRLSWKLRKSNCPIKSSVYKVSDAFSSKNIVVFHLLLH